MERPRKPVARQDDPGFRVPTLEADQPDPMLEERRAGPFRTVITVLVAIVVVCVVLYGLNQAGEPTAGTSQMANASAQQQPSGGPSAPVPNATPTTTGQGQPGANQGPTTQAKPQAGPRADSATTGAAAPGDKPAAPKK